MDYVFSKPNFFNILKLLNFIIIVTWDLIGALD